MDQYKKIFMVGIAMVISIFFAMGARAQPFGLTSQREQETQHQILSSENGRFVFGQISDSDKDKFMLDTFTGRLWRIGESGKMGIFLMPVLYRSAKGEYSIYPEDETDTESEKEETK